MHYVATARLIIARQFISCGANQPTNQPINQPAHQDYLVRISFLTTLPVTKTRIAIHVRACLQIGACFGRALLEVEFVDGLYHMELHHKPFSISPPDFLSKI